MRSAILLILSIALIFALYKVLATLTKIKREITKKDDQ
jgi:hypothetical protein